MSEFPKIPRRKGKISLIYRVGVNDADYQVEIRGEKRLRCPYFTTWSNMIKRCYNTKTLSNSPTYNDTTVCDEWLTFSQFKSWMETQDWEGKELDKDLLGDGGLYSPETCVFVNRLTNCFMLDCGSRRGSYRIGVDLCKPSGRFRARCSNPFTNTVEHLGYHSSEEDANSAWRGRKRQLAVILSALQEDDRVAERLIHMYEETI